MRKVGQHGKSNQWLNTCNLTWLKHSLGALSEMCSLTYEIFRDLYVQALAALQQVDESEDLSYYGIMGECYSRGISLLFHESRIS